MTAKELLEKARSKIVVPIHWTRYRYARHEPTGEPVPVTDPAADCFCALGAIYRVAYEEGLTANPLAEQVPVVCEACAALAHTATCVRYGDITGCNDRGGHDRVMAMFNEAIAAV